MATQLRFTIDQYDRMIAKGIFDARERQRLELIKGETLRMTPIGPDHEVAVDALNEWSMDKLPRKKVWVRIQQSIGLRELARISHHVFSKAGFWDKDREIRRVNADASG